MQARRIVLVVDSASPLEEVDAERAAWEAWVAREDIRVALGVVVFGRSASWLPDPGAKLVGSSAVAAAGKAERPALGAALAAASAGPRSPALVTVLAREPAPRWEEALDTSAVPFRACVSLARDPVAAIGSGYLGANFRGSHLGLALRWLTCELCDRTHWCECGQLLVYDGEEVACACGKVAPVPARLRIRARVVLLSPGARLYPHHAGRPLDFEKPIAFLDDVPRVDGSTVIDGISVQIRTRSQARSTSGARAGRFRAPAIVARTDRCSCCDGELTGEILHRAPDPRRFCAACVEAGFECDFCWSPVSPTLRTVWPDGRKACRECWSTCVTDITELQSIVEMSRAWLERRLKMTMPSCPVEFEHAAEIARMNGRVFQPTRAAVARPVGFFRVPSDGAAPGVFVEHGTPLAYLYGVVTHELTHVWQWDNWPREVAPTLREGLAMWAEYQALLDAGAIHAARHAELYGDPTYGLGFRVALAVERDAGFDEVKNQLCHVKSVTVAGPG